MISHRGQDERIVSVVSRVMKLNPGERETYVRLACAGDTHLYHEITEAVDWEQRMGDFLQQPLFRLQGDARPFATGQVVSDRFEIIREIGEGGMGVVYEAFDRKRNQRIAIKSAKPGFHQMLSPEVEGALRVRHPNVCLVNEIHTAQTKDGEVDFITMELLQGTTLASRLSSSGRLPVNDALEIARQLCNGLKAAHASGVVHGDLKTDNIFLCRESDGKTRAVITDFGLSGGCSDSDTVGGTPRYMAPELWLGERSSQASDIYALGVIFHEMVTGSFTPSIDAAKPKLDKSDVPRFYPRMVEGCLSFDPARRLSAFSDALQSLEQQKNPWTRRKLLISGVATACAAGTSLWWNRDTVENRLHPLPHKRFVALLPWPATSDSQSKPLLAGIIDAIENELARAEVSDRDLYVISAHQADSAALGPAELRKLCQSVGANLLLGAFLTGDERQFRLRLTVQNALTDTVLRHRQLVSTAAELTGLIPKAVVAAAALLNVRLEQNLDRLAPPTDSVIALTAFQKAEELKSHSNDMGLESAIDSYKKAIDADPHYVNAYAKLAIAYSRFNSLHHDSGALELAQRNAEKAISLDEKSADAHLALATVFAAKGNESQALSEIDEATKADPTNPRTVLWKAQVYRRFHHWTEAEQAYEELKRERPNYWLGYHELGVLLNAQGRYQEALQAFQAAAAASPGSALPFTNLGALQFKLGNFAQAESSFRKSVALQPNDVGYSNLADVLRAQGKYADAVQFSQQAVKLNPSDDQNWLDLGDAYEALRGKTKQAHEAYLRAASEISEQLKTDPTDGSSWVRLALYQLKSGSPNDATSLLNKADSLGATDVDTELAKARVLELLHRRKEALLVLASCFRRGTTTTEVSCIRDLDKLRKDPEYSQLCKRNAVPGRS